MFDTKDFCQVCRHYDIGSNQCSKAPKRAIPKSKCADYEYHTHEDLCKYCSHNNYGRCTIQGHLYGAEPFLVNICKDFENKKVMEKRMEYEKKEWLCARCANQCKADGEMDYCEKFIDEEEAARIANAERIAALRNRCEEFMQGLVRDFGNIIVADTVDISETERKDIKWNKKYNTAYLDKQPFIDFRLCFKTYKID